MSHHHKRSRTHNDSGDEDVKGSNFSKRRKFTESHDGAERRIESLIIKVGENTNASLETSLESASDILDYEFGNNKRQILDVLLLVAYQLPEKCTIYTTLTGLLNRKKSDCGSDLIEMLLPELQRLIETNQFQFAQNLVRFLSDLVNVFVVKPFSILALFNSFVSVCKQEKSPQCRKDWYVYVTLASLPWVGAILQEECPSELEILLSKINQYIDQREKLHHAFLRVWKTDDPHPQEEYLDCLFKQITKLKEDHWSESLILRPYRAFEVLRQSFQHNIPDFVVPPHVENKSLYPSPIVVFRMFDYTDCPDGLPLPGNRAIERWLIEDSVRNIVATYKMDKKDCAARLLQLYDADKLPLNYILVECLFGDLFCLPNPTNTMVFYTAIFIELCKLQPNKMPQVLALASDMLFERLDTMNVTCMDRFVNWFSHHLSNFQFTWSWDEWETCLDSDLALPRPKFIKEVLEKSMRLSYYKKIGQMISVKFESLCPPEPVINFKFEDEINSDLDSKFAFSTVQKVMSSIKSKASNEEMMVVLEQMIPSFDSEGEAAEGFESQRIEVFLQLLLYFSQKSFSHSFSALSKYHKVLKWAAPDKAGKAEILRITQSVWQNHTQMISVLVDKMLRLSVVSCSSVAEWIFSSDMATEFTRMYVWEIMHSTIRRMGNHLMRVEREHNEIKIKSETMESDPGQDETQDMMGTYNAFAPSKSDVNKLNVQIEAAQEEQKRLFLTIFQSFITVLKQHLERCDATGVDFSNPWYINTLDRLKEIFILHRPTIKQYNNTLDKLLFHEGLDSRIRVVFQQYMSLEQ